MDNEVTW